jgi:hypothetical protein
MSIDAKVPLFVMQFTTFNASELIENEDRPCAITFLEPIESPKLQPQ